MTEQDLKNNVKKTFEKSKEQYDYMTKGLNNKDLVVSILNGKESYAEQLKKVKKASMGFFAVSMAIEVAFMFLKTEDPILAAIKDLSNKIDNLSNKISINFKHLEKYIDYSHYKSKFDTWKSGYTDILELYEDINTLDQWGEDPKSSNKLRVFISDTNIDNIIKSRNKVLSLVNNQSQGVDSIIAASFGDINKLNNDCTYLLSAFCQLQTLLLLATREAAYSKKKYEKGLSKENKEKIEKQFKLETDNSIKNFDTKYDDLIKGITSLHDKCLNINKYCPEFIEYNDLIIDSTPNIAGVDKIKSSLKSQFPLFEFFCCIYSGVSGSKNHSIGPKDYDEQYKSLRVKLGETQHNVVIYWWKSEEIKRKNRAPYITEPRLFSAMGLPDYFIDTDIYKTNVLSKLDDTVSALLVGHKNVSDLTRAISLNDCGIINDEYFPSDYMSNDGFEHYNKNRKNKIYYSVTDNVQAHIKGYYDITSFSNTMKGPRIIRTSGIILFAEPKENMTF